MERSVYIFPLLANKFFARSVLLLVGVRGAVHPPRAPNAFSGTPFFGLTLIAQKKDDVLSDKLLAYPLTSCRKCAKITG